MTLTAVNETNEPRGRVVHSLKRWRGLFLPSEAPSVHCSLFQRNPDTDRNHDVERYKFANTSAFTRALAEAETRQHQQLKADYPFTGTGKRGAYFLEEDDNVFPSAIHLTSTGVSQLKPIASYPTRGYIGSTSAVFRHATPNDFLALPLPTVDLTQYPFTWTLPGAPIMPMPPTSGRATINFRSRSPPTTPYVKRQRFNTPPPSNGLRSPSPYPSPLSTLQPASISPRAERADSTPPSSRRVTRSGRTFAQPWRGDTLSPSASVPRPSVQYSTSPLALPIALPALPAGLPTPTPGLPNVLSEPHACVLQCSTSFNGVFKPGARPRGDRYKTHMFGSGSGKKNPPCSVAVQMGCTKNKSRGMNVEVVGTFLLHKEPGLAPTFEYAQICGDLREALVAWYAELVAQAAENGSVEQEGEGEADDGLTDRDAEYDEEVGDDADLMYE